MRRDAIIEQVKKNVAKAATEAIAESLPSMLDCCSTQTSLYNRWGMFPPSTPLFLSNMKKIIMSLLAAASLAAPALADPITEDEYFTPHAHGCMLLQECTDHVQELKTVSDLNKHENWLIVITVLLLMSLTLSSDHLMQVGVKVFLGDMRYFPVGHRGVYHTVSNNFFLNKAHMHRPEVVMAV